VRELTPREIVAELDRHIVGQDDAKRAVAVAIRNRWRRQHVAEDMRAEVAPKNIMMIGPTGVGKTEIARRLAKLTGVGMEQMDMDLQGMFEKILPKHTARREMTVAEAREVLFEQECDALINQEKVHAAAVDLAESVGIIFIDELDKIVASEHTHGADVSRQGVQRDLLPIVEGTTVQTRYGFVRTDHILFIAAGAFHRAKPSDLMPELQGRFPIRVELKDLTREDFVRILTEPKGALTKQYEALLATEGIEIVFQEDAVESLADFAFQVNQTTQNIGARRLYTIMERLLEELSFEAPDMKHGRVEINAAYVRQRLAHVAEDEDLSKFIL